MSFYIVLFIIFFKYLITEYLLVFNKILKDIFNK